MKIIGVLVIIITTSIFKSAASLSWCPVGIHIQHALKDYSAHNLENTLCIESCIIFKNFTYGRTGHTYIAGSCVPTAKCDSSPSCTNITSYIPHLKNRVGIDGCSSSCCKDEASCRQALKVDDVYQNPTCQRNEGYAKALDPGRECRKRCKKRSDCKGKLKRCECDDWCGFSCFNPNFMCALPPVRKPMIVDYSGGNKQIVQYSCADGYFLSGNSMRKCRTDKKFSGRSPTCKAGCKPPKPLVANSIAVALEQGYEVGEEVNFVCQYGYQISGTAKVICKNDGSWSGQNFKCERNACGTPPRINENNVSPDAPVVFMDETGYFVAQYRCADGFKLKSGSYNTFCNVPSATWSPLTLICEPVEFCTYSESHLQPGVSVASDGLPATRYPLGKELILLCNGVELARLRCLQGSVWSDDIKRLNCPDESCTIDKTRLQENVELVGSSLKYAVGKKATFRCQLRELKIIECQKKALWSEDYTKLKCEEDRCPEIKKKDGMTVWYWGKRRVSYQALVSCEGKHQLVYCGANLQWNPPPICSDDSCKLPTISDGLVVTKPTPHRGTFASGTTITFGCKNPRMTLQGIRELTCVSSEWNGKPPVCGCGKFENKPAHLTVTLWNKGTTAQFRCDVGYDLIGEYSARCLDTGLWSNPMPICQEIGCEIDTFLLPLGVAVSNPQPETNDGLMRFSRGETIGITCSGKPVKQITCGKRSTWSEDYLNIPCQADIEMLKSPDRSPTQRPVITTTKLPERSTTQRPSASWTKAPGKSCNCVCGNAGDTLHVDEMFLGKVVGGNDAVPHAWPWQAVVLAKKKTGNETITDVRGGGTLISQDWILTAAHVFEFERRRKANWHEGFVFGLGTHDIDSLATLNGNEKFFSASFITIHENFDIVNMANDVALVRLGKHFDIKSNQVIESSVSGKVTFNRHIRPICLPCMDSCTAIRFRKEDFNKKSCDKKTKSYKSSSSRKNKEVLGRPVVTGYGHTEVRSPTDDGPIVTATILQQASLTIRTAKRCKSSLDQMRKIVNRVPQNTDGAICASSGKLVDSCTGDSGGPLSRRVKVKSGACWLQVGIVSWGLGCAAKVRGVSYPGYYVDVAYYMPWIIDIASRTP